MSLNGANKAEFLVQFLKTFSRELAEGEIDNFDIKLLEACVLMLKTVKSQLKEKSQIADASTQQVAEPPPAAPLPPPMPMFMVDAPLPPPMPLVLHSTRAPWPTLKPHSVKPKLKAPSTAAPHQTLIKELNAIKQTLADGIGQPHRLNQLEEIEDKRRAFFIQRAKDRSNPEACSEFSLQLLKDVVHTRKNLQKKTELVLALEREARFEKSSHSLAKYEERLLQKQKIALAKEIDELILSFVEVEIEVEPNNMEELMASFVTIELPALTVVDELTKSMMAVRLSDKPHQSQPS